MSTPHRYRVVVRFDAARQTYVARAPELPSCEVDADTRAEALAALETEIDAQVATIADQGGVAPTPVDELREPDSDGGGELDGRIAARVSTDLHRELLLQARAGGVTTDALVGELLAEALALRTARDLGRRPRRGRGEGDARQGDRRPRGRDRGAYNDIMENKSSFLEYVRGLEREGGDSRGQGGRRGGGRGGGRRGGGGRGGGGRGGGNRD
jgi:predicted RNase H-like HicB family nuclease